MSGQFFQFINIYYTYSSPPLHSAKDFTNKPTVSSHKDYERWIVLTIGCLGMFAYNYCYDNVVALQNELQQTYNLSNIQYNLLYSVYSFPNILIPAFSGILNDYVGVNITVLLFFTVIVMGHATYIIGCWIYTYPLMLIGRLIFGIGCESYATVVTPLIYEYFHHKELALALALLLSLARVGSSINDVATYYFYRQTNSIIFATSIGFFLLLVCFLLLLALICHRLRQQNNVLHENVINNAFKLSDLQQFDSVYWMLTLNCGVIYGCVMSWMNIGTDFLQKSYGYSHGLGNILLMVPYVIGSVITPIFGLVSDHIGKRTQLLSISTIMLVMSHFLLGWEHNVTPFIALIGLGVSYSIFCAVIWPSFAQVVNDNCVGTAYGIPTSFYNLIVSMDYIVVGALTSNSDSNMDETNKYLNVEWFLLAFSLFSGVSIMVLAYFDRITGNRLAKPAIQISISQKIVNA